MFFKSQYGFRNNYCTQHAILDILNKIQSNMDKKLDSCRIFIDLKKAFVTLQKRALRLMYFVDYKSQSVPLFVNSGILPVKLLYFKSVASNLPLGHTAFKPKFALASLVMRNFIHL